MAKKYIFADSNYNVMNPPKGVTVLEFDTETNTFGIYNNKKATATIPVQVETDNDNTFNIKNIPTKLSELQNDKAFITLEDIPSVESGITEEFLTAALKSYTKNYSAFQVMPNKTEITSGTVDDKTGLTYNNKIPPCTIHKMTLRSTEEPENCDVIIDWGDGTIDKIKNNNFISHTAGKSYELEHDYSPNMTSDIQRFTVKIYGRDYYTFRHNSYKANNLISQIFDANFPIASHITNFASMAYGAARLLKVQFPHSAIPFSDVINWSSCFNQCGNIISITGFENIKIRSDADLSSFMAACGNLVTTDFVFPAALSRFSNIFTGDKKLERDINSFIPKQGFTSSHIMIRATFSWCEKITGTVPADKFWNNPNIVWSFENTTDKPFKYCSAEIRAQVPISWGGTASDDIIKKSIEQRLAALEQALL